VALLAACAPARSDRNNRPPPAPSPENEKAKKKAKENAMPQSVVGTVTLDGKPLAGVEVVLTDGAGTALASQATDATGRFRLDPPGPFADGWVVARLHEPIVGAATRAVAAGDAVADLAVASSAAVTLSLTVKPPARVPLDWAIVKLSPRAVPGVPDPVIAAAKLVGTGPSVRGSYHQVRITGPRLDLRVLPGTWGIAVEHIVERSPTLGVPPPDWINDALVLADGTRVPAAVSEHRLSITGDVDATIECRVYDQGVPHGNRP
jgi:hypothetical protein